MKAEHKARARSIAAKLMGGKMTTLTAGGAGAAVGVIGGMLQTHTDLFRKYWYSVPLLTAVGGHVVKQTVSQNVGSAMLGSAGTLAYYGYKLDQATKAASGGGVQGLQDTRGLQDTTGPGDDYVKALAQLPETSGVQVIPSEGKSQFETMGIAA